MIDELRLLHFKCFRDQTLRLAPLTLLTGVNGMGKSSALQALLALRQSHGQGLLARGLLALNGEYVTLGTAKDALFSDAQDDVIGFDVSVRTSPKMSYRFVYDPTADVMRASERPSDDSQLWEAPFQYLCAERIGPRPFFATSDHRVRHERQIGTRGEHAVQFLSVFGEDLVTNPRLLHPSNSRPKLRAQTEAWLSEISPGTRLVVTAHPAMDVMQLGFEFSRAGAVSEAYRPTNVGFGLTYTLPVLITLLAARPGSTIVLENPEAHLHPRGQLRMGELLGRAAAGGVQVLVETHSDHLLNGVRLAVHGGEVEPEDVALHYFYRGANSDHAELASPRVDRNGRIDDWPDGFFDEWDAALDRLLKPAGR